MVKNGVQGRGTGLGSKGITIATFHNSYIGKCSIRYDIEMFLLGHGGCCRAGV